jgi:hypothetical protein
LLLRQSVSTQERVGPGALAGGLQDEKENPVELEPFQGWRPRKLPDPKNASSRELIDAMVEIVAQEGPILGYRLYQLMVKASGGERVSKLVREPLNRAAAEAIRRGELVASNPSATQGQIVKILRLPNTSPVRLRTRGDRRLEEIPMDEVFGLADLLREQGIVELETLKRRVLDYYELVRMTPGVSDYLDECFNLGVIRPVIK